jgi:hypothetical protein
MDQVNASLDSVGNILHQLENYVQDLNVPDEVKTSIEKYLADITRVHSKAVEAAGHCEVKK